jgi:threonylcarbamoyladenosine tRNA methylthiotransferase MtaB
MVKINSDAMPRRAAVHTLGCRLNQSESQLVKDQLERAGYTIVGITEPADVGIINTCTVTREADAKCRQAIRGFIRRNPDAFTAVIGCYSQMGAKAIAEIGGVDLIIGNEEKLSVLDYLALGKNARPLVVRERIDKSDFSIQFAGDTPYRRRANLKIQDGCDFMCAFCIIPAARGRGRSRQYANLLDEARALAARGVREIVLTGVNIGTYRGPERDLLSVVDGVDEIPGIERIRISSIEPTTVPPGLFDRMADPAHALLPYLHLPLQSGSDRVLRAMRRRYTVGDYLAFVETAHARVADLCLGTDIMVGHPQEDEAEFLETCRVFRENRFVYCHVFPYSERAGTAALRQPGQVPVLERQRRSARLRRLSAERRYEFHRAHLGREMEVLFEDPRAGVWPGLTGNYIRVVCQSREDLSNRRAVVRLDRVSADFVEGTVLETIDP